MLRVCCLCLSRRALVLLARPVDEQEQRAAGYDSRQDQRVLRAQSACAFRACLGRHRVLHASMRAFDFFLRIADTSELTTGNLAPTVPSFAPMSTKSERCAASDDTACEHANAHIARQR